MYEAKKIKKREKKNIVTVTVTAIVMVIIQKLKPT